MSSVLRKTPAWRERVTNNNSLIAEEKNFRLMFEPTSKYIRGWIEHNTGTVVASASSSEWCIRQFLYSAKNVSAARNIGRVLAHRCLQTGIHEVHSDLQPDTSEKVSL